MNIPNIHHRLVEAETDEPDTSSQQGAGNKFNNRATNGAGRGGE